ncbi:MAG: hypothetical protein MJD61_22480 [Proteobacteria bacterium]|nr:hypothetical protein [Pseudomonadota bacterium]
MVKVCGLTCAKDVDAAAAAGADALGFVLSDGPCKLSEQRARRLLQCARSHAVCTVAVVGRMDEALRSRVFALGFDILQAVYSGADVLRAIPTLPVFFDGSGLQSRIRQWQERNSCARGDQASPAGGGFRDLATGGVLVDGPAGGGKGIAASWPRVAPIASRHPLVLAGGLTPENVVEAIRTVGPHAVDVSSGVEAARATKDAVKIRAFIAAVRSVG